MRNPTSRWLCLVGLSVALLSTSGCVSSNRHGASGDVTFFWTFDRGLSCSKAGIDHVVVTIPGQTLENHGSYNCTTQGTDGIVLRDFAAGNYQFTLQAYDANNYELYGASGSFTVNGNVQVTRDLAAYGYLSWDFATAAGDNVPTCNAQNGAVNDMVEVDLFDGNGTTPIARYSCLAGMGTGYDVPLPYLTPGQHSLTLASYDSSSVEYAYQTQTVTITPTASEYVFNLAWEVGDVTVAWDTTSVCGTRQVVNMSFNFVNSSGTEIFAHASQDSIGDGLTYTDVGSGNRYLCSDGAIQYSAIPAGAYAVEVQGTGLMGAYYSWDATYPATTIDIVAGNFGSAGTATTEPVDRP